MLFKAVSTSNSSLRRAKITYNDSMWHGFADKYFKVDAAYYVALIFLSISVVIEQIESEITELRNGHISGENIPHAFSYFMTLWLGSLL